MNALIVKNYAMDFQKEIHTQIIYEEWKHLKRLKQLQSGRNFFLKGHNFGILQNNTPTSILTSTSILVPILTSMPMPRV
jgi:hypothetical protein